MFFYFVCFLSLMFCDCILFVYLLVFMWFFIVGVEIDELDSNVEEFEDEFVEFFVKEEIIEVEE